MRLFRDTSSASPPQTSGADLAPLRFRPVERQEIHAALRLILSTSGASASEEQVVDFLRFALYRGIDLKDIWVADSAGKMQWAILPVLSPGRTMLLFAPSFAPPRLQNGCICPLIERILEHYRSRAIDLAQVLIDPTEAAAVQMYQACGFGHLAELIYLDREVRRCSDPALPPGYAWQTYSGQTHPDFARAVSASYEGSLDCPHLNGRRNIEDVLAGHKAAGEFDPSLWLLLRYGATPAGVMLLNRSTRSDAIELVYLGLIPRQRGRHLGDLLMQRALWAASSVGARRLSLAVDSSNLPALRLYRRHGMAQVCSRIALMRDLREPAQASPISQGQRIPGGT
jgi:ribosomal protein S18 acetylase RimI-like enzyme